MLVPVKVPVTKIRPNPNNPRKRLPSQEKLRILGESLLVKQINPIRLNPLEGEFYTLIAGECRWRAAMLVDLRELDAIISEIALSPEEIVVDQLTDNLSGGDLAAIDKGEAFDAAMRKYGWSADELGRRIGVSSPTISKTLSLDLLTEPLKQLQRSGDLLFSHAYQLSRIPSPVRMEELAKQCVGADRITKEALTAIVDRELNGAPKREKCHKLTKAFAPNSGYDTLRQYANALLAKANQLEKAQVPPASAIKLICEKGV